MTYQGERDEKTPFVLNAWYVIAWPKEVTAKSLLARTVCDQALVLWRDENGNPSALEDRCCHREMPLAKGMIEHGTVRCKYHGLRFAGSGECVEVPGMANVPKSICVRSYPTVERHGWVWVWPGDADHADAEQIPEMFTPNQHPDWESVGGTTYLHADYRLVIDNLLDLTHETYLHPTSLGSQAVVHNPLKLKSDATSVTLTRWMLDDDPGPFWQLALKNGVGHDGASDRWQVVNFQAPSSLALDVGAAPAGVGAAYGDRSRAVSGWNLNAITPETETTTWYFWAFARDFLRDDEQLSARLAIRVAEIFEEDREAVESVQSVMNRCPGRPLLNLKTDAGGVVARRIIDELVAREHAQ